MTDRGRQAARGTLDKEALFLLCYPVLTGLAGALAGALVGLALAGVGGAKTGAALGGALGFLRGCAALAAYALAARESSAHQALRPLA